MTKIYLTKEVEQNVLTDITCNVCGKSCLDNQKVNFEYAHLVAHWGYNSKRDTEVWFCELCEECAVKVKEFIESLGGHIGIEHSM